jgi:hypothetical protein
LRIEPMLGQTILRYKIIEKFGEPARTRRNDIVGLATDVRSNGVRSGGGGPARRSMYLFR